MSERYLLSVDVENSVVTIVDEVLIAAIKVMQIPCILNFQLYT